MECGITSFGVSITTMEEVFLKVGHLAEERYNYEHGIEDESSELIEKDDPQLQSEFRQKKLKIFEKKNIL